MSLNRFELDDVSDLKIIDKLVLKFLTLKDPFISERCIEIKIELNFYFHTSLWCLKRFYFARDWDVKG